MFLSGTLRARDQWGRRITDKSYLMVLHAGDHHQTFVLPGPPCGENYRRVLDTTDEHLAPSTATEPAGADIKLAPSSLVLYEVV